MGWIGLGVLVAAILFAIVVYNRLVALKNRFRNAFAQIDVQLKRRYDLIPNLVEAVKGYMKHERETLEAVIAARRCGRKPAPTASRALPLRSCLIAGPAALIFHPPRRVSTRKGGTARCSGSCSGSPRSSRRS